MTNSDPMLWWPGSFFRRPEWRWLRAGYLAGSDKQLEGRIDDDWVALAWSALLGCHAPETFAILAARDVWTAETERKWELEARLLTDEPLPAIAERLRLPLSVVEAYAEVFFSVRSEVQARDWLMLRAVGYSALSGFSGPQPGALWKYAAHTGGPFVLDVVIAVTTGRPLPAASLRGTGVQKQYAKSRLRLLTRIWGAAMTARTDEEFARVAAAYERLHAHDTVLSEGTVPSSLQSAVEVLKALPVSKQLVRTQGRRVCASRQRTGARPTRSP